MFSSWRLPRNAQLWLPGYVEARRRAAAERCPKGATRHVLLSIADHFEPGHGDVPMAERLARVRRWETELPQLAAAFRDADGRPPRHTFFFPVEQYHKDLVGPLRRLDEAGYGEVEVHLHHDGDTGSGLHQSLMSFTGTLAFQHGLLARAPDGTPQFGFVHGDWALDNSHPHGRYCGVNDELTILQHAGCYADFTMPCAPAASQTRTVNMLYYAIDDPQRPKSHDRGIRARVGAPGTAGLLMVQGPLGLDWSRRKFGVVPRLDNGAIDAGNPPTLQRFLRWVDAGISVEGRPAWVFIKLHTHGALPRNAAVLLGDGMARFHRDITRYCRGDHGCRLHYVTAREMVNIIRAAEAGERGDPGQFRDYELRRA